MPIYDNENTVGSITPAIQNISWDRQSSFPTLSNILVKSTNAQFVEYYIQFENSGIDWLELVGYPGNGGYLEFFGSESVVLNLKNLDQLPGSNYKATIQFRFTKAEGADLYKTAVINLTLSGSPANAIQTDKTNYNLIYNRATNVISGETIVNILNNASGTISFETIGSLLKEKNATSSFTLEDDPENPFSTNSELPEYGTTVINCRLRKAGAIVNSFTVTIAVIGNEELIVDPSSLGFILRKGLNESKTENLRLINPLSKIFTITGPTWLNFSQNSGNSTVDIIVTTINSENIAVGDYDGNIVVSYDSKQIIIPVDLIVSAFSNINLQAYNFCLDDVILKVSQFYDNARFVRITADMEINSIGIIEKTSAVYFIPYFQNKATIDIGSKVQNYFPIYNNSLFGEIGGFNNQLVYKPVLTQIKIEEIDINYQVLHTQTIDNVKFFAGKKPALFPLFTNFGIRRKYSASVHFFSYFTGLVNANDFTGVPTSDNPAGNFEVQAVALKESEVSYPEMKNKLNLDFLTFPDVEKKVVLQWTNQNLVPEWFIFSGDYKITTEFEHAYDNVMINGRKYDSKDLSKLTIYTGFILREEKNMIKEIIRSLTSFIKIEGEVFNCISITQKLIEKDSTEDLITFELEYLIVK